MHSHQMCARIRASFARDAYTNESGAKVNLVALLNGMDVIYGDLMFSALHSFSLTHTNIKVKIERNPM